MRTPANVVAAGLLATTIELGLAGASEDEEDADIEMSPISGPRDSPRRPP